MKLQIESVMFRNFLSFGSRNQEISFHQGTNIVLGKDFTTGRSNGAGKSSFLETIPFAFFGTTHKDIVKSQLVNWKNRKQCEVALKFQKGDDSYLVARCIKPDNFEIYENDSLIEKTPHVRDYQKILEDIIGLNFNTFGSLIHSNINSANRILSMKKPNKRKFIEEIFGLGVYSTIHKNANEKLRGTNDKIKELDSGIQSNNIQIESCNTRVTDLNDKIKHIGSHEIELREAEIELQEISEGFTVPITDQALKTTKEKLIDLAFEQVYKDKLSSKIRAKAALVMRWGKENEDKITEGAASAVHKQHYKTYCANKGKPTEVLEQIEQTKVNITKFNSDVDHRENKLKIMLVDLTESKTEVKGLKEKLDNLINHSECPTCGQTLKDTEKNIVTELEVEIKTKTDDRDKKIRIFHKHQRKYDEIFNIREEYQQKLNDLEHTRDQLYKLKDMIKFDHDIESLKKKKSRYLGAIGKLSAFLEKTDADGNKLEKQINRLKIIRDDIQEKFEEIQRKEREISGIQEKIKIKDQTKKEFEALIATEVKKAKNLKESNEIFEKKRKTFINITDYLNIIKEICKDENIKQYAISSIMPYLNQQTNYYLSEVGYGFYTILDKWLDAEIRGPGIKDASYGSLSGGEGRGIDLAMLFALLDIARVQAGIWPDILVIDEFLDTSVDSSGIGKLLEIVKAKQMDDKSKIFIISHRDEIDKDLFDNVYFVKKEKFSEVIINP